ncbi:MAG: hypothetical protein ABI054_11710, partial [Planctomycetota bacterium]
MLDLLHPRPVEKSPNPFAPPRPAFPWPESFPNVVARGLDVTLGMGPGSKMETRGLDVATLEPGSGGGTELEVRAAQFGYSDPHFGDRWGRIHGKVRYRSGVFEMPVFEYDDQPIVREISCDLRLLADGKLSFAGIADLLGGAQEFHGSIGEDELDLWVETHELRLG